MKETWVKILGYENYEISDLGNVKSIDRFGKGKGNSRKGQMLKQRLLGDPGYLAVTLYKESKRKDILVHRAMLLSFVGVPNIDQEGCHNDGNRLNNILTNLRWGTKSENNLDRVKHGTHTQANRTHCPLGHLLREPNLVQSRLGIFRECLSCHRAKALSYRHSNVYGVSYDLQKLSDDYYSKLEMGKL